MVSFLLHLLYLRVSTLNQFYRRLWGTPQNQHRHYGKENSSLSLSGIKLSTQTNLNIIFCIFSFPTFNMQFLWSYPSNFCAELLQYEVFLSSNLLSLRETLCEVLLHVCGYIFCCKASYFFHLQ
jgi:hypothetical protein